MTVAKIRWNARSLYKKIKDRLPAERNELQASLSAIRLAAQDKPSMATDLMFYARLVGDLELCARVYGWEGLVGLMEGDENAPEYLYHATYYEVAAKRLMFAFFLYPSKTARVQASFSNVAMALARAVTLGCRQEVEELVKILCTGLTDIRIYRNHAAYEYKHSYFSGTHATFVAPFILYLYSQARGTQFPLNHLDVNPLGSMQSYEPLLHLWQTTDVDALQQALFPACDLHMLSSKPQTNRTIPEFWRLEDMLYPAEILMLLRLRETAGLTTPAFDHPLLNTAVGRLCPICDVPHDPLLDKALANGLQAISIIRSPYQPDS